VKKNKWYAVPNAKNCTMTSISMELTQDTFYGLPFLSPTPIAKTGN
jgi:hypothetical protein